MADYRIKWEIDVEATGPLDALAVALENITLANDVFEVSRVDHYADGMAKPPHPIHIDLEEGTVTLGGSDPLTFDISADQHYCRASAAATKADDGSRATVHALTIYHDWTVSTQVFVTADAAEKAGLSWLRERVSASWGRGGYDRSELPDDIARIIHGEDISFEDAMHAVDVHMPAAVDGYMAIIEERKIEQ